MDIRAEADKKRAVKCRKETAVFCKRAVKCRNGTASFCSCSGAFRVRDQWQERVRKKADSVAIAKQMRDYAFRKRKSFGRVDVQNTSYFVTVTLQLA